MTSYPRTRDLYIFTIDKWFNVMENGSVSTTKKGSVGKRQNIKKHQESNVNDTSRYLFLTCGECIMHMKSGYFVASWVSWPDYGLTCFNFILSCLCLKSVLIRSIFTGFWNQPEFVELDSSLFQYFAACDVTKTPKLTSVLQFFINSKLFRSSIYNNLSRIKHCIMVILLIFCHFYVLSIVSVHSFIISHHIFSPI